MKAVERDKEEMEEGRVKGRSFGVCVREKT